MSALKKLTERDGGIGSEMPPFAAACPRIAAAPGGAAAVAPGAAPAAAMFTRLSIAAKVEDVVVAFARWAGRRMEVEAGRLPLATPLSAA